MRFLFLALAIACSLAVTGCSDDATSTSLESPESTANSGLVDEDGGSRTSDVAAEDEASESGNSVAGAPTNGILAIPDGPEAVISLQTDDGVTPARPIVSWDPIPGAVRYELLVRTDSGELYWAWQGTGTTVPIGGAPQLGPNSAGPALAPGMTWYVVAVGEDGFLTAQSELMIG